MIDIETAKTLDYGDVIYANFSTNADGSPSRFRVTGKPKTWKRDKNRIKVPLKHGLYHSGELTNGTREGNQYTYDLSDFELNEQDAIDKLAV